MPVNKPRLHVVAVRDEAPLSILDMPYVVPDGLFHSAPAWRLLYVEPDEPAVAQEHLIVANHDDAVRAVTEAQRYLALLFGVPGPMPRFLVEHDELITLYGAVCDVVERVWQHWPLTDDTGVKHTSDDARAAARRIFELLDIGPLPESVDVVMADATPRMRALVDVYVKRWSAYRDGGHMDDAAQSVWADASDSERQQAEALASRVVRAIWPEEI